MILTNLLAKPVEIQVGTFLPRTNCPRLAFLPFFLWRWRNTFDASTEPPLKMVSTKDGNKTPAKIIFVVWLVENKRPKKRRTKTTRGTDAREVMWTPD